MEELVFQSIQKDAILEALDFSEDSVAKSANCGMVNLGDSPYKGFVFEVPEEGSDPKTGLIMLNFVDQDIDGTNKRRFQFSKIGSRDGSGRITVNNVEVLQNDQSGIGSLNWAGVSEEMKKKKDVPLSAVFNINPTTRLDPSNILGDKVNSRDKEILENKEVNLKRQSSVNGFLRSIAPEGVTRGSSGLENIMASQNMRRQLERLAKTIEGNPGLEMYYKKYELGDAQADYFGSKDILVMPGTDGSVHILNGRGELYKVDDNSKLLKPNEQRGDASRLFSQRLNNLLTTGLSKKDDVGGIEGFGDGTYRIFKEYEYTSNLSDQELENILNTLRDGGDFKTLEFANTIE